MVTGRSKLTLAPLTSAPRVDLFKVSCITSAVNPSPVLDVTVKQTPLTAIESPIFESLMTSGPVISRRTESSSLVSVATWPNSSTIPVNK